MQSCFLSSLASIFLFKIKLSYKTLESEVPCAAIGRGTRGRQQHLLRDTVPWGSFCPCLEAHIWEQPGPLNSRNSVLIFPLLEIKAVTSWEWNQWHQILRCHQTIPFWSVLIKSSKNKLVVKEFVSHSWSPKPFKVPLEAKDLLRLFLRDHSKTLSKYCTLFVCLNI